MTPREMELEHEPFGSYRRDARRKHEIACESDKDEDRWMDGVV